MIYDSPLGGYHEGNTYFVRFLFCYHLGFVLVKARALDNWEMARNG